MSDIKYIECDCGKRFISGTFKCDVCNKPLALRADKIVEGSEVEQIVEKGEVREKISDCNLWYFQCPSCSKWLTTEDKRKLPKFCMECGEPGIQNISEDEIISEEIYRREETGEKVDNEDNDEVLDDDNLEKEIENDTNNIADEATEDAENSPIKYVELTSMEDGKIIHINPGKYLLGRKGDIDRDYFVKFDTIGRKHLYFYVEENKIFVEDAESINGTFINGIRIEPYKKIELVDGDRLAMYKFVFEVRICR